jgi:predicted cupin superfamily sugar epimerase
MSRDHRAPAERREAWNGVQTGPVPSIPLRMNEEAARLVSRLALAPLPGEGGYFARTWTSPRTGPGGRALASAIVFMITGDEFSALHRIGMDEVWQFGGGDPAELVRIDPATGALRACVLGADVAGGQLPQAAVPAGEWQGARVLPAASKPRGWSLFGCLVAPAWDEREFELGRRDALLRQFPAHAETIRALTR